MTQAQTATKPSRIVLGTDWMIAYPNSSKWNIIPASKANTLLEKAIDLGINAFDTARVYSSEGILGRFIKANKIDREKVFIISKCGHPGLFLKNSKPISNQRLEKQLEASLKALNTEYIDVFLLHYDDPSVPTDEIVRWSLNLLETGKTRQVGYSNFSLNRLAAITKTLEAEGHTPWVSAEFNCLPIQNERWRGAQNISQNFEYLQFLKEKNIPFLAYSALGRGYLKKQTDRIKKECFKDFMQKTIDFYFQKITGEKKNQDSPEMITQISKLTSLSEKYQVSPVIIAIEYVLRFSKSFYLVLGTSNPNHLEESFQALKLNLSVEDLTSLSVVPKNLCIL